MRASESKSDRLLAWNSATGFFGNFGMTLLSSEITKVLPGDVTLGNDLVNAPDVSITGTVGHDFNIQDGLLTVQLNTRYGGDRFFSLTNTQAYTGDDYILVDLMASYRFGSQDNYVISAWGKNITNELVVNNSINSFFDSAGVYINDPATYGISVGLEF